jgi:hypothetical protein
VVATWLWKRPSHQPNSDCSFFVLICASHSGYYDGATILYEYAWAQSFHFSRFYKGEAFQASVSGGVFLHGPGFLPGTDE